jgi:hypothetical protein
MTDADDVAASILEQEIDLSRRGLLFELVNKFQGLKGVADEYKKLYNNSADTPSVQAKLLDIVVSGIFDLDQETTPQVPEDELMAIMRELISRPEIRPLIQQLLNEATNGS